MLSKNGYILVLWIKVALALNGLTSIFLDNTYTSFCQPLSSELALATKITYNIRKLLLVKVMRINELV